MKEHRGGLILGLGISSLVLGLMCMGVMCIPLPLPLGIAGWVMGKSDLELMARGEMDPSGRGNTHAGMVCSIISVAFMGIALAVIGAMVLFGLGSGLMNSYRP